MMFTTNAQRIPTVMVAVALSCLCFSYFSCAATAAPMSAFSGKDYKFDYPQTWGVANAKSVAAQPLQSPGDVPDDVAPLHTEISFSKSKATVCIYPVKDSSTAAFKKKYGVVSDAVQSLMTMLAKHPAKPKDVPILPWGDVATPFYSHVKYLESKGNSALRFVGQYNTENVEINNAALTYTAQGLSKGSNYYISVSIPVSSKVLPDKDSTSSMAKPKYEQFDKNYDKYTASTATKLNAEPETAFKPLLTDLDAIVNSIATPH